MKIRTRIALAVASLVALSGVVFATLPAANASYSRPAAIPVRHWCYPNHTGGVFCVGNAYIKHKPHPSPSPTPTSTSPSPSPTATSPSPSPTSTSPSPSPSPTTTSPSPSPSPTSPSPSPTGTAQTCTFPPGDSCGPYEWNIASNGFNSYVVPQGVGPQTGTAEKIIANSGTSWTDYANDVPYGYTGVQTAPQTNQLLNDWCPTTKTWADPACASNHTETDTPFASLSALSITYSETSTQNANSIYEYGIDTWPDNYGNDIMTWTDTSPTRCTANGLSASDILGQMPLDGKNYTLYRYGGPGGELVFILDGTSSTDPVDTGTCARQFSGTIDVLGEYKWMVAAGIIPGLGQMGLIVPAVWEVTSADHAMYTLNSLSMTMTPA